MRKILTIIISLLILTNLVACKAGRIVEENIKEEFKYYTNPPAEIYSGVNEPPRILPANPADCPAWKKNETVQITESMRLPAGCKYDRVKFVISHKSDLVFDCNGAELNGLDKEFRQKPGTVYIPSRAPLDVGIMISSSESKQSRNITVKNCHLKNYVRGIRVAFGMSAATLYDLRNNVNVEALENHLRTISPANIRVEHSTIDFSHKDGVYVGRFVNGFVLDHSSVNSTGVVGLYLDSGSSNSLIKNSTFTKNGYSRYVIQINSIEKELKDYSREAIAIDSSFNNRIEGNTFSLNSRGAVFLYKNCNEFHKDPNQIPRYQSADGNIIKGNIFKDEKVGVWVASRQSEDLRDFECGIPQVATGVKYYGPYARETNFYQDYAKNNQVLDNTFENIHFGVIVEDDDNTVKGNSFTGTTEVGFDIKVGTKYRTEKLAHPVTNTKIIGNHFNPATPVEKRIVLKYSPVNTVISENTPADVNP